MDLLSEVPKTEFDEKVAKNFQSLYIEEERPGEGEDADPIIVMKLNPAAVGKKVAQLDTVLGEKKKVQGRLEELEAKFADVDLDEFSRLRSEAAQRAKDQATKDKDFDALRKQMEKDHQAAVKKLEDENQSLLKDLQASMVDTNAVTAIERHGGSVKALLPHVQRVAKVVLNEESGRRQVRILDEEDGGFRTNMAKGEPFTVDDLVQEMRGDDAFAPLFSDDGRVGSGARPKGAGGTSPPGTPPAGRAPAKGGVIRLSREDAKDSQKYRAAQAEAEKTGARVEIESIEEANQAALAAAG